MKQIYKENCNKKEHMYKKGDRFLLLKTWKTMFNQYAYLDPYVIKTVRNNGTDRGHKDKDTDTFNICNNTPYEE